SGHDKEAIAIKDENGFVVWHSEYGQYKHWEVHQKKNWFQRNFPHVADWEEEHFAVFDTTFGRLHNHAHEFLEDLSTVTGIDSKVLLSIVEEIAFDVALYALEYFMPFTTELLEMLMAIYSMMGVYEFLADADSVKDVITNLQDTFIAEGGPLVDVLNMAFPSDTDTNTSNSGSTASPASSTGNQNYASSTSTPATAPASATYTPTMASASAASAAPTPATSTNTSSSTPTIAASTNTPSSANTNNASSKKSSSKNSSSDKSLETFLTNHRGHRSEYQAQGTISLNNLMPDTHAKILKDRGLTFSERFGNLFQMRFLMDHPRKVVLDDGKTYRHSNLKIRFREEAGLKGLPFNIAELPGSTYIVNSHQLVIPLYWDNDKNLGEHKDGFFTGDLKWQSTLGAQLELTPNLHGLTNLLLGRSKTPKVEPDGLEMSALPTPQNALQALGDAPGDIMTGEQVKRFNNSGYTEEQKDTILRTTQEHGKELGTSVDQHIAKAKTNGETMDTYNVREAFPEITDPRIINGIILMYEFFKPDFNTILTRQTAQSATEENASGLIASFTKHVGIPLLNGAAYLFDHIEPSAEIGYGAAISHNYNLTDMTDAERIELFAMQTIPYTIAASTSLFTGRIANSLSRFFPVSKAGFLTGLHLVEDGLSYAADLALENRLRSSVMDRSWSTYVWFTGAGNLIKGQNLKDRTGHPLGQSNFDAFNSASRSWKFRLQHIIKLEGDDFFDG
ncbi:MAG: hypothetical protein AAF228_13830, partial [Pseudomonadota bacterium]